MQPLFEIKNLNVEIENKQIINNLNIKINPGEIHAIMGPNGSGKSTLSKTIMGHPKYKITNGEIKFENQKINTLSTDERAKKGIFLGFQNPEEIQGVKYTAFLKDAYNNTNKEKLTIFKFQELLKNKIKELKINEKLIERYLNTNFSGGEKKKTELLQMAVLQPKLAILDEIDSGLDIDGIKQVAEGIKKYLTKDNSILLITHYKRLLDYITPDYIHVMVNGQIVKSGDSTLADRLEEEGYTWAHDICPLNPKLVCKAKDEGDKTK